MEILLKGTVSAQFRTNHPNLCRNCAFPQDFHIRKLDEIAVFFTVRVAFLYLNFSVTDRLSFLRKKMEEGIKKSKLEFRRGGAYIFLSVSDIKSDLSGSTIQKKIICKVCLMLTFMSKAQQMDPNCRNAILFLFFSRFFANILQQQFKYDLNKYTKQQISKVQE